MDVCLATIGRLIQAELRAELRRVKMEFCSKKSESYSSWKPKNLSLSSVSSSMIEVVCNDRLGKKVRVKCNEDDTIGDLKKLIAAQIGTKPHKLRLQKWHNVFKDHITLDDYEIHDGMGIELYYN